MLAETMKNRVALGIAGFMLAALLAAPHRSSAATPLPERGVIPQEVMRQDAAARLVERAYGGDVEAMFQIGSNFYEGRAGFPKDWRVAHEWLLAAAVREHNGAQFAIAAMYLFGRGVAPDASEAFRWYERLALKGDPGGQFATGVAYEKGIGISIDHSKAALWFQRAADQGRTLAKLRLGELYESGRGVAKDEVRARKLYEEALSGGEMKAGWRLGLMYKEGRGGVQRDLVKAYNLIEPVRGLFEEADGALAEIRAQMTEPQRRETR